MRRIVMIVAIMGVALRAGGLIVAESTYSGLYPKLFVNWFLALLLSIALIASSLFLLDRYDRRPWLVAVVAVAALASIAVTTMIEGIHMRRAKRSMAFLRTATTVIECMRKESGDHPKAKTVSDLTAAVPVCISQLEPNDGWGRPIRVSITANSVVVTSLGADGRPDPPGTPRGASYDPARDIIMINGEFVSWPMGTATH